MHRFFFMVGISFVFVFTACEVLTRGTGAPPTVRVGMPLQQSNRVQVLHSSPVEVLRRDPVIISGLHYSSSAERLSPPTLFDLEARLESAASRHLRAHPETGLRMLDANNPESFTQSPVLKFTLLEFEDRKSTRGGAEQGANVFIEARMIRAGHQGDLFLARYAFREQAITDNVLSLPQKLRDQQELGAGFKSAAQVFEKGVEKLLVAFEGQSR